MSLNLIFDVLTGKWVSAIPTAASKKTGLTGTDGNDNLNRHRCFGNHSGRQGQ